MTPSPVSTMKVWTRILILAVTAHCVVHAMFYGQLASLEDYPYMASLICKNRDNVDFNCCSGVIISHRHILTTAYCLNPDSPHFEHLNHLVGVRVGSTSALGEAELLTINKVLVRVNFDTVGLVGVYNNFAWSDTLRRAYLPVDKAPNLKDNQECKYLGWGSGNADVTYTVDGMRLRYADAKVLDRNVCVEDKDLPDYRDFDMHCTTNIGGTAGTGAYSQDRGAPLVCDYMVYGLIEAIKDHNADKYYMGYINAHQYYDWIESTLQERNDTMHYS